jgi:hypothetical protein
MRDSGMWASGPSMAAGYVTLGLGSNSGFGGTNGSSFAFSSNAPNAMVSVGGNAVVIDGPTRP